MRPVIDLFCECEDRRWILMPGVYSIRCPECGVLFIRVKESEDAVRSYNQHGYLFDQKKSTTSTPMNTTRALSESVEPTDETSPNDIDP